MKIYSIPISAKGILFKEGKVWLRKNERNEWELPGGKLDEGEQPEQAVMREMQEELGFNIDVVDIIQAHLYTIKPSTDEERGVLVISYLCKIIGKTGEFEVDGEVGNVQFHAFPVEEILTLTMPAFYKSAIQEAWDKCEKSMKKGVDYIGVAVGAIVFNKDGLVLLAKRGPLARNEKGKWEFPGGGVEFNEKCEDAIKREVKEEFDIGIEVLELLEVTDDIILEEHQHWVAPSYCTKHISGEPRIMEPGKIDEVRWFSLSDIDERLLTRASRSTLKAYAKKYSNQPPKKLDRMEFEKNPRIKALSDDIEDIVLRKYS